MQGQQACGVYSKKEEHPLCARNGAMPWDLVVYGTGKKKKKESLLSQS